MCFSAFTAQAGTIAQCFVMDFVVHSSVQFTALVCMVLACPVAAILADHKRGRDFMVCTKDLECLFKGWTTENIQ